MACGSLEELTMFPADKLKASGGGIHAHLFENSLTGISRNLFWSVRLGFEPIKYEGDEWECSMTCEWIPWRIRDWRNLHNLELRVGGDDQLIESSFYMAEHDEGRETSLRLQHQEGHLFKVRMSMVVDFTGYTGRDRNPEMSVAGEALVPFKGVYVVPENLFPKPMTVSEVKEVAQDFIDLSAHREPYREKHKFIFEPLI
jgi:hypothetical protein